MAELAKRVVLRQVGGAYSLTVDDVEFPWHVAASPAPQAGPVSRTAMPTLTLTLLAERVEVEHDLDGPAGAVETV